MKSPLVEPMNLGLWGRTGRRTARPVTQHTNNGLGLPVPVPEDISNDEPSAIA
jgi:hypothetical protein